MSESQHQREFMLHHDLVPRGITNSRVLAAMRAIPREEFVPCERRPHAYADHPLPIGCGQTISQPFTVAMMAEALQLDGSERVLEIGTGCGYGAAVLSYLASEVHSVERIAELAESARERLAELGFDNVTVHAGDGSLGLPDLAPFDAIVVTAAAPDVPPPLIHQLAVGGRLVIPIGPPDGQRMCRITKRATGLEREDLGAFIFVPLIGTYGREESKSEP